MSSIYVGTQSWFYKDWIGAFYPPEVRQATALATYAKAFSMVEADSTFYGAPAEKDVRAWCARTPDTFRFTLKMPREITSDAKLRDIDDALFVFLERAALFRERLGAILIQFGPDFGIEYLPELTAFLAMLPRTIRFAVEFRRREWVTEATLDLLKEHEVALALVDGRWIPRKWMLKLAHHRTAPFAYIRLMGPDRALTDHSHVQISREKEIGEWIACVREITETADPIFLTVSNYYEGHAPATARRIQDALGIRSVDPSLLSDQMRLL